MTRKIVLIAASLMLASMPACAPISGELASTPGPLQQTEADERAIALAFGAAEELTRLSATARKSGHGCCQPGTPSAVRVATLLDSTAHYLEAASAAQRLANSSLAELNLREAYALIAKVRRIVAPASAMGDPT